MKKFQSDEFNRQTKQLLELMQPLLANKKLTWMDKRILRIQAIIEIKNSDFMNSYPENIELAFSAMWNQYNFVVDDIFRTEIKLDASLEHLYYGLLPNKSGYDEVTNIIVKAKKQYKTSRKQGYKADDSFQIAMTQARNTYVMLLADIIKEYGTSGGHCFYGPPKSEIDEVMAKYDFMLNHNVHIVNAFYTTNKEMHEYYRKKAAEYRENQNYEKYGPMVSTFGGRQRQYPDGCGLKVFT